METELRRTNCGKTGEPPRMAFTADWENLHFFNYSVDVDAVQPLVPFELDRYRGKAYVSLVCFSVTRMELNGLSGWHVPLLRPFTVHEFLNVRTYVIQDGEPGIYFITEFVNRFCSLPLGFATYGLPYRYARIKYDCDQESGRTAGRVERLFGNDEFSFGATMDPAADLRVCEKGGEAEFLLERYSAYTRIGPLERRFRIRHEPWRCCPLDVRALDDSLIRRRVRCLKGAKLEGACYSPGAFGVQIGLPQLLN